MSEKIRKMYKSAGVPFPKGGGKGIHTSKFHKLAISIKKKNPQYDMSRCYKIAMGVLGPGKAVKKAHRRSK